MKLKKEEEKRAAPRTTVLDDISSFHLETPLLPEENPARDRNFFIAMH